MLYWQKNILNLLIMNLKILNDMLNAMSKAAKLTPFTVGIGVAIDALRPMYEQSIDEIDSPHVTLH